MHCCSLLQGRMQHFICLSTGASLASLPPQTSVIQRENIHFVYPRTTLALRGNDGGEKKISVILANVTLADARQ